MKQLPDWPASIFTRLLDDLGGHPEGCAHEGVPLAGGVGQLPRHAEVSQLYVAHVAQQHVGGLQQQLVVVLMLFVLQVIRLTFMSRCSFFSVCK